MLGIIVTDTLLLTSNRGRGGGGRVVYYGIVDVQVKHWRMWLMTRVLGHH